MNKLIHLTLSIFLLIIVTANPELTFGRSHLPVYFGIGFQKSQLEVEGAFSPVSRSFSGIDAYAGIKINDYVAIEAGFNPNFVNTENAKSTTEILGKCYKKPAKPVKRDLTVIKNLSVKSAHVGLSFTYPIHSSQHGKLEALGNLGANFLRGKADHQTIVDGNASGTQRFAGTKVVPRALVGLQYVLDEQFGVRTYVGYSNTSRLVLYPKNGSNLGAGGVKFKDTTFVGAGLFLTL